TSPRDALRATGAPSNRRARSVSFRSLAASAAPRRGAAAGSLVAGRSTSAIHGLVRTLRSVRAHEEHGTAPLHGGMYAREPLFLREAGEVPFVLLHVRAEALPERARVGLGHRHAVDEDAQ